MKSVFKPYQRNVFYVFAFILFYSQSIQGQQAINSISTSNVTYSQVSHTGVKGAGLRNSLLSIPLISSWDSLFGASYTVNFGTSATADVIRLNQFSVGSISSNLMTLPVTSYVKIRRAANADVGDARNYYNFWARYSSIPNLLDLNGTFNFTAPEVTDPEQAFMLNNLTSGYDNIFQNTIDNPHFGNIERIDYIVPSGLYCHNNTDRMESGIAVIDRGTGDPFKIAAITAIDANGTPTAFGSLVSVTAANFGGNLLGSNFDYGILINDSKFKSESRPSARANQNLRGVYISLANLGLAVNQRFYGYALFGPDVVTANPDWNTYPTNTAGASELDPVNIMGLFKTAGSVLPVSLSFTASRADVTARLDITLYNEFDGDKMVIERSADGVNFSDLSNFYTKDAGKYTFIDTKPSAGNNYYRIRQVEKNGKSSTSEIRMVKFEDRIKVSLFPNPATDKLTIQLPSSWAQQAVTAEIFTSAGQLVKRLRFDQPGIAGSIQLNSLKPGAYLLRLVNATSSSVSQHGFTVM